MISTSILGEMIWNDGIKLGFKEGVENGSHTILTLATLMVANGHADEIPKLQEDEEFLSQMMDKYQLHFNKMNEDSPSQY